MANPQDDGGWLNRMSPATRDEFLTVSSRMLQLWPQVRQDANLGMLDQSMRGDPLDPASAAGFFRGQADSTRRMSTTYADISQLLARAADLITQEFPPEPPHEFPPGDLGQS